MSLTIAAVSVLDQHGAPLFSPLSFSISAGEVLTLMGPSGCGKSTLLSVIAGHQLDDFSYHGDCFLNDKNINNVAVEKRNIGLLFQDDLLFPHLNIWENLAIALPNRIKGKERKQQALATLDQLNLSALADKSPTQISGGQRARISLMRMLLAEPDAVLLDEPFSKLDKSLRAEFRDWVFSETKARQLPVLMVTHDSADIPTGEPCLHWPWTNNTQSHDT